MGVGNGAFRWRQVYSFIETSVALRYHFASRDGEEGMTDMGCGQLR